MICKNSSDTPRRTRWWNMLVTAWLLLLGTASSAQVTYNFNFDANSTGWTGNFGQFTGATACGGSGGSMRYNLYSFAPTAELISPQTGTSVGGSTTISYTYKAAVWSANTAAASNWGNFIVQYGSSAAGPWTNIATVTNETQLGNACISKSHTFTPPAGALFIRWNATWQSGDYYLNFDNVSISEAPTSACTGAPNPGNTLGPVSICSGANFTLSLQNATLGSGVSRQWQRADDLAFTVNLENLGTATTQTIAQLTNKYYRCLVTCAGNGTTPSNPLFVETITSVAICGSYCIPTSTSGCSYGDLIARVVLNTLDNNTGTTCTSFYNNFTTNPLLTTTLQAGSSYNCQVFSGAFSQVYAVWIDYNDDGIFDTPSERVGFTSGVVPANSSASFPIALTCNPPLGNHRMRVRSGWNVTVAGANITPCGIPSDYGEVEDYLVSISAADPCPAPVALTASNFTSNSADLSWTLGCAESLWDVHVQNAGGGAPPVSPSNPGVTNTSLTAGSLVPGQIYEFFVRARCGVSLTSTWTGPFSFSATPPNDVCADITPVTLAAGATVTASGSTYGALENDGLIAGVSAVWHAVTISECVQSLTVSMCGTVPVLAFYYGPLYTDCALTQVYANGTTNTTACTDGNLTIAYGQLAAGTYYFPVFNNAANNPPSVYQIAFTAGAACPPPPANDLCANAQAVTCGVTYTGNTVWATSTGAPTTDCITTASTVAGVWYTVSGVCGSTTASLCTGTDYDSKLFVYTGTCGGFNCVSGNDDACGTQSAVTWDADAATTYYIYVTGFGTATGNYSLVVNCGGTPLAASASVVDDCNNGTYTVNVDITDLGSGSSADIVYSVDGGGPQTVSGAGLGVTPIGPFTLTQTVAVSVSNGATGCGVDLGTYDSSCPITINCGTTTTLNYCYKNNDTKTWTFTSSNPNETLTLTFISGSIDEVGDVVRIYSGTDNSGSLLASSSVSNLANLTGTSLLGVPSIYMEVVSDGSNSCQDGNQTSWVVEIECTPGCTDPEGSVTVTTDCANYQFSMAVEVLGVGDGTTTTLSYTVNGGAANLVPGLVEFDIENIGPFTVGDDVIVFLNHEFDGGCNRNLGSYTDDGTCLPLGSNCLAARPVTSYPYTHVSTTCGFGNDLGLQCNGNYGGGDDYVYRLEIPFAGIYAINLTATGGGSWIGWFLKDGASCNTGSSCLANVTSSSGTVANGQYNFPAAGTYFLIIDTWPSPNCSAYTLNISFLACAPATAISTSLITSTQAQVNFTGETGNYIVEYGPAATFTTPGTGATAGVNGTIITGTTSPIVIAGLSPTTQYRYFVRRNCGVDGFTPNSSPILFTTLAPPPPNDLCANAVAITCGSAIAGTTTAATTDTPPLTPFTGSGGATINNGVWYVYTGDDQNITVSTCSAGTLTDSRVNVYRTTAACTGFVAVAGNDDQGTPGLCGPNGFQGEVSFDALSGFLYYVVVDGYFGAQGTFTVTTTCNGPTCTPLPGNDDCVNAQSLTAGAFGTCTFTTGTTQCAAPTSGNPFCVSSFATFNDVYYSFVAGASSANVRVNNVTGTVNAWALYDACGGSQLTCSNITGSDVTVSGLNSGSTYIIRILSLSAASFNICVSNGPPPPANDACANAIAVGCNSQTNGTTVLSSTTGEPGFCGTDLSTSGGVWYTIAGWDGPMSADLCTNNAFDSKLGIFTGSCGAFTCVTGNDDFCGASATVSWTGVSGVTYYIYVTGFSSNTGSFTLTTRCGDNNTLCTENGLTLEFQTDAAPFETTWEIRNEAGSVVATSGGPLVAPFGVQTENGCVPDGCYTLRVLDAAGDGMTTGGYILRTQGTNQRIIDNRNNFNTGAVSAISGGQGFCLPMSNDKVIFTSCDKLDWINGQYVVASPNAAVSAEWIVGGANSVQDANSGYEFWIFDPNGSYSFRRFRSHNVSDGFGPASATRACHMKLNNWALASQVPAMDLMNVRVRARVNGVNGEFGPACRLAINPVLAACPQTNLMDVPGSAQFSCGVTRQYGPGNYVYARPVTGANRYQFRFRIVAEGYEVVRTTTSYTLQLNWALASGLPLQDGKTYDVDVRVSKDAGATWCTSATPWGNICSVTIDQTPAGSGNQNFAAAGLGELRMFPNPNRGDLLNFSISDIEVGVNTVSVDIFDLFGKRISARTIAVTDGNVNTTLDLNGELAAGMYLVNITAGETLYTERLVIQP